MPVLLKNIQSDLEKDLGVNKGRLSGINPPNPRYRESDPKVLARKVKEYTRLRITRVNKEVKPNLKKPDDGQVLFTAICQSEAESGIKYKVWCEFNKIKFRELESKRFPNRFSKNVKGNRTIRFYANPSARLHPVRLRCQCQDFRHRFENQLSKNNALIGGPRKYQRKTRDYPDGRPKVNSQNVMGVCKHLYSFVKHLQTKGFVK